MIPLKFKLILGVTIFWNFAVNAQHSVNASGGKARGKSGSISYSIGQVSYTTNSNKSGTVAQGVQQAYEIIEEKEKDEYYGKTFNSLEVKVSVYPNPTSDFLKIALKNTKSDIFRYQLVDLRGKVLDTGTIFENQAQISMQKLANATYFVNIINQDNKKVKTFKVIKN